MIKGNEYEKHDKASIGPFINNVITQPLDEHFRFMQMHVAEFL